MVLLIFSSAVSTPSIILSMSAVASTVGATTDVAFVGATIDLMAVHPFDGVATVALAFAYADNDTFGVALLLLLLSAGAAIDGVAVIFNRWPVPLTPSKRLLFSSVIDCVSLDAIGVAVPLGDTADASDGDDAIETGIDDLLLSTLTSRLLRTTTSSNSGRGPITP